MRFTRLAQILVGWWDADDNRELRGQGRERNDQTELGLKNLLESFLLRCPESAAGTIVAPVVDAVDRHPREVHWIIQGLVTVEDRLEVSPNTDVGRR